MIAAYIRVSDKDQSLEGQRAEVRKWIDGQGINPAVVTWYEDVMTGRTNNRPELKRLQADIFHGRIKQIVVWKLDRLSRQMREGMNLLVDWCEKGIRVVSVTQQLDLSGSVGRMVAAVILGIAEIEWEYRKERQAAGIAVAKRLGKYRGRKPGTTTAEPSRAAELRAKGLTVQEIATSLGVSHRTAARYLAASK